MCVCSLYFELEAHSYSQTKCIIATEELTHDKTVYFKQRIASACIFSTHFILMASCSSLYIILA